MAERKFAHKMILIIQCISPTSWKRERVLCLKPSSIEWKIVSVFVKTYLLSNHLKNIDKNSFLHNEQQIFRFYCIKHFINNKKSINNNKKVGLYQGFETFTANNY